MNLLMRSSDEKGATEARLAVTWPPHRRRKQAQRHDSGKFINNFCYITIKGEVSSTTVKATFKQPCSLQTRKVMQGWRDLMNSSSV